MYFLRFIGFGIYFLLVFNGVGYADELAPAPEVTPQSIPNATGLGESENSPAIQTFYPDGSKAVEAEMTDNQLDGVYRSWRPDGKPSVSGQYRLGKRIGHWTYWSPNGTKKAEGAWKGDVPDGAWTTWNEQGEKVFEGEFEAGRKVCTWRHWIWDEKIVTRLEAESSGGCVQAAQEIGVSLKSSFLRFDVTDSSSTNPQAIVTSSNFGLDAHWKIPLHRKIRIFPVLGFSSATFAPQSTQSFGTFSKIMYHLGVGGEFDLLRNFSVEAKLSLQSRLFFQNMATSSGSVQNLLLPSFGVSIRRDLIRNLLWHFWVGGGGGLSLPGSGDSFSASLGGQFFVNGSIDRTLTIAQQKFSLSGTFGYLREFQNTSFSTQGYKEVLVVLGMSWLR